jgi:hypothetical protein
MSDLRVLHLKFWCWYHKFTRFFLNSKTGIDRRHNWKGTRAELRYEQGLVIGKAGRNKKVWKGMENNKQIILNRAIDWSQVGYINVYKKQSRKWISWEQITESFKGKVKTLIFSRMRMRSIIIKSETLTFYILYRPPTDQCWKTESWPKHCNAYWSHLFYI